MATYTGFGTTTPGSLAQSADTSAYTLGNAFYVTAGGLYLTRIRNYIPSGSGVTQVGWNAGGNNITCALFAQLSSGSGATGSSLITNVTISAANVVLDAWQSFTLSTPYALAANTVYYVCIAYVAGDYPYQHYAFSSTVTAGPIVFPADASTTSGLGINPAGGTIANGAFTGTAAPPTPPSTGYLASWYGVDVEISDGQPIASYRARASHPIRTSRSASVMPPIAQVAVAPPAYPPAQSMPQRHWRALRRAKSAFPVQPQLNPPRLPDRVRILSRFRIVRRGSSSLPVQPQLNPFGQTMPPRRWRAVRRALSAFPVQPQASVVPPSYPPAQSMPPRRWRALRRASSAFPVQPQSTVIAPNYPPAQSMPQRHWRALRRASSVFPVQPQLNPPRLPDRVRILSRFRIARRGSSSLPVQPQLNPPKQPSVVAPRHPIEARRRPGVASPPIAQVVPPPATPALQPQPKRARMLRTTRARVRAWLWGGSGPAPLTTRGPGPGSTGGAGSTGSASGPGSTGSVS